METKVNYKSVTAKINYNPDKHVYKVWIPGTDSFRDLLISLNCRKTKRGNHAGIEKYGEELRKLIANEIELREWERTDGLDDYNIPEIIFGGHSLGGALVGYIVSHFTIEISVDIKVAFLYGSYRCTDFNSDVDDVSYRKIICDDDKIPYLFFDKFRGVEKRTIYQYTNNKAPFKWLKDHNSYSFREFNDA